VLVRTIGSFHVGGRVVELRGLASRTNTLVPGSPPVLVDPNGDFHVGQMYIQFVRLVRPRATLPLVLMHGGHVTGACWETTPDGRPGWQSKFLEAGFDVMVCDTVERGRAGWSRFPEIFKSEPFFRSTREAFVLFRIGAVEDYSTNPALRRAFAGQRFPLAALDNFAMQMVPRWNGNEPLIEAAYDAALQRIGPCLLLAHSQGGGFAFGAALRNPDLVRALIVIEPGGAPHPSAETVESLRRIPMLFVWGDYIDRVPFWAAVKPSVRVTCDALAAAGGNVEWIDLPTRGIRGNSHFIMMDDNSDAIADLVIDWCDRQKLRAPGDAV
jgi:hypothetical protein